METLKAIYHIMPADAWMTLIGGPVASLVLTRLKKWLALESEKVIVFLLFVITTLGGIATYLATSITQTPLWIAPFMGIITTVSLGFYHLLYKPAVKLVQDANAERQATNPTPAPVEAAAIPTANGAFN